MNRYFGNYNDYEIIYLIKDGNEKALEYMFKKYEIHIFKIADTLYTKSDKVDDLLQEGRMVLYSCIYSFNENYGISFFAYFTICLKRTFYKLIKTEYYNSILINEDKYCIDSISDNNSDYFYTGKQLFKDELFIMLFDECVLEQISITEFSKRHNLPYNMVYYKYKRMVLALKRIFSLD